MPNCREVTTLVLAGEDRRLTWIERLRVRSHLLICSGCTNFTQQRWQSDPADAEP